MRKQLRMGRRTRTAEKNASTTFFEFLTCAGASNFVNADRCPAAEARHGTRITAQPKDQDEASLGKRLALGPCWRHAGVIKKAVRLPCRRTDHANHAADLTLRRT